MDARYLVLTGFVFGGRGAQVNEHQAAFVDYLRRLHLAPGDPRGLAVVARGVGRQAQMGAILDAFKLITWSYVWMAPLVFLLRRSLQRVPAPAAAPAGH